MSNTQRLRDSVVVKVVTIGVLTLMLLIPALMINATILERSSRNDQVVYEIGSKWSGRQHVTGPVLVVPFRPQKGMDEQYAYFLPEQLHIRGDVRTQIRYRDIYSTVVYEAPVTLEGTFVFPDFDQLAIAPRKIFWDRAHLEFGVTDMQGLGRETALFWGDAQLDFEPTVGSSSFFGGGMRAPVTLPSKQQHVPLHFSMTLLLRGSRTLEFVPLGKETTVELTSPWSDPSFQGAFLPIERVVSNKGFRATWHVLHFNRSFPQRFLSQDLGTGEVGYVYAAAFGVELLQPVEIYRKTARAVKYAVLFLLFTFTAFFLVDILQRHRVHPMQYLLTGSAICVFYLLLLSLGEHIGFGWSYMLSSIAVITLIVVYTRGVFVQRHISFMLGSFVAVLYAVLYVLLQLQDYALLVGSLCVFTMLAMVMYLTRRLDWYQLQAKQSPP